MRRIHREVENRTLWFNAISQEDCFRVPGFYTSDSVHGPAPTRIAQTFLETRRVNHRWNKHAFLHPCPLCLEFALCLFLGSPKSGLTIKPLTRAIHAPGTGCMFKNFRSRGGNWKPVCQAIWGNSHSSNGGGLEIGNPEQR